MGDDGKVTIRFEEFVSEFLRQWAPFRQEEYSPGGACRWAVTWAAGALRSGMIRGLSELSDDEKKAILACENGWYWRDDNAIGGNSLALELHDFFALGEGMTWEWEPEAVADLCHRVGAWGSDKTCGVLLWAAKYWEGSPEVSVEEYLRRPVSCQPLADS